MMWRYDFRIFYLAGRAVLNGNSPYLVPGFISPYLLALIFAPLALLPEPVAYFLFVSGQLYLLWKIRKNKSLWAVFSFPVFFDLFVGQVDLFFALLSVSLGIWAFPLLLAKPQVLFVIGPWTLLKHRKNRGLLFKVALLSVGFIALSFSLRPTWFTEWRNAVPPLTSYACRDSNLYWLVPPSYKTVVLSVGVSLALLISPWLKNRRLFWTVFHSLAPLTNIYSAAVLFEWIGPLEMLLSWLAILWVGGIHRGAPMFVVALSILLDLPARFPLLRRYYVGRTGTHP